MRIFIYGEDGFTNIILANSLSMFGFDVIGEIDNEIVALNLITRHCPDVVILELNHQHIKALELSKNLRKRFPKMGIVLATKTDDLRLIGIQENDLPTGVMVAHLAKHCDLDNLRSAIEVAPHSTSKSSEYLKCDYLSDVQIETFRLMAEGNANSEIAKMRFVSEKSVEQMLARIAITLGLDFDRKHNSRVRLTNTYHELVNGRK
jgi:DNA-binding NarL/FixJ family response regulator